MEKIGCELGPSALFQYKKNIVPGIVRWHFQMIFLEWKLYFDSNLTDVRYEGSNWQ